MARIDEIKARLSVVEDISPKKWSASGSDVMRGSKIRVADCSGDYPPNNRAHAEFIANAPEDVRYLLAQLEAYSGFLALLIAAMPDTMEQWKQMAVDLMNDDDET